VSPIIRLGLFAAGFEMVGTELLWFGVFGLLCTGGAVGGGAVKVDIAFDLHSEHDPLFSRIY
jgi:hypothetical protein